MNSAAGEWELPHTSFLIRRSPDQRLFASFPEHIAGYHVLHRLSMPRHPPYTLSSLTTFIDHRHDPSGEELALQGISSGRAENGTNNRQRVTFAKKVLDDSRPTEKPKKGGGRVFNIASRLTQFEL